MCVLVCICVCVCVCIVMIFELVSHRTEYIFRGFASIAKSVTRASHWRKQGRGAGVVSVRGGYASALDTL